VKRVPPTPVRRLVVGPLVAALDAAIVLLSPLALLVAALLGPLLGGTRALRVTVIAVAYAARHLEALVALLALWARSGFGRRLGTEAMEAAHYEVMRRFVAGVHGAMVRAARVEVTTDETEEARRALLATDRPLVVLSRHAGEGDTILVIHELLCRHGRRPRVVMHEALRLDPLVDVLGSRLPNRFVDPRGGDTEHEIAAMARDLDGRGAVVIFPEGANFTEESRRRGIARLERAGHARQADVARSMRHVSAPRPGGALAAIDAAPGADVVVIGHVGFPTGLAEAWRLLPERQRIDVKVWHEAAEAIPAEHGARIAWLFEQWRRLDEWVDERRRARGGTGY
jgi:1-acyl-sn-glycerol-3-phosphate acyltransferase